jgi:hypothetical protein
MKGTGKFLLTGLCSIFLFFTLCLPVTAQEKVVITGTVNENYQIEDDDGELYDIGENEKGDELGELIGARVRVTGMVQEEEGLKTIMVTSFEVIKK